MSFSDNMELKMADVSNIRNKSYIQDARVTPWNKIKDKQYDMFVALQVFEHLGPKQSEIFTEIKRISKHAIISIPYLWNCPHDLEHHMVDDEKINKWTNNTKPINKQNFSGRLILTYKF